MKARKKLIEKLFEWSQKFYLKFKKKEAWGISCNELLALPKNTFGNHLGVFLHKNGFELIGKVERHDAYHVLTGFGTKVEEEIALQYVCFGNGKRTPYLTAVLIVGTALLPEYLSFYRKSYAIGKQLNSFHHFDYKLLLTTDFENFRKVIFSKAQLQKLQHLQNKNRQVKKLSQPSYT